LLWRKTGAGAELAHPLPLYGATWRTSPSRRERGEKTMRRLRHLELPVVVMLAMLLLAACSTASGRTAGENFDDASITAQVKAKLAGEKVSTLAKVDVDTNLRTVTLHGVVDSEALRQRATAIAWSVRGVNGVINNLTVKTSVR
jgi:hypothetical protein